MMKALAKFLLPAAVVLLCIAPRASFAQGDTAAAVSDKDAALARKLLDEGVEAGQKGDYELARDKFQRSFNLKRSYDTATNLGKVEEKLGRYRDAAEHLDYALRHYPTAENQDRRVAIERLFEKVQPRVGAVRITVDTPGARLFLDDRPVGTSPLEYELFVEDGAHTVRADFKGKSASGEVNAKNGRTARIELVLAGDQASLPASGLDEESNATGSQPNHAEDTPGQRRNWIPAYVLGGVTVAALGTSLVFRGLAGGAFKKKDDLIAGLPDDTCADGGASLQLCRDVEKYGDRANTRATIADASLITTAVLGAVTVGYVLFTVSKRPTQKQTQASLSLERGGVSFSLSGEF